MNLYWIAHVLPRYEWTSDGVVRRLQRTVWSIGTDGDSLMTCREFLPEAEEQRLVDYLGLTLTLLKTQPDLGPKLRPVHRHLQGLLDRAVPENRRDDLEREVADGVRRAVAQVAPAAKLGPTA